MYRKPDRNQLNFLDFYLPFGGKLDKSNRWVILSQHIPWDEIEDKYAELFTDDGAPAKMCRVALGALLIKEKQNISDEETVLQITENPYLQYFIGYSEYSNKPPFDPSLMVHFRKRFTPEILGEINEKIFIREKNNNDDDGNPPENKGTLILDATCAPADIKHPTDLDLINEAREKTDKMIDALHKPQSGKAKRPRTHRKKARKAYLKVAKKKQKTKKDIRTAVGKQLRYLSRNLSFVDEMIKQFGKGLLDNRQIEQLETIKMLYTQQKDMYDSHSHKTDDRIVSISQPHVRPIVRGKARARVEFGAKVAISIVNGYTFMDEISWDNFNEGAKLAEAIEKYRKRFGCYPKEVIADKIYRNAKSLEYCKDHGIRLSGPPLGRPKNDHAEQRKQEMADTKIRNQIECKFGEGKRKYGLDLIMTKLKKTSETAILLKFLVMNLQRRFRVLFTIFAKWVFSKVFIRASYPQKFKLAVIQ